MTTILLSIELLCLIIIIASSLTFYGVLVVSMVRVRIIVRDA